MKRIQLGAGLLKHGSFDDYFRKPPIWIPLDFGKHEGLTIPEIIFIDPGWFYWALFMKLFRGPFEYQAMVAAFRMSHMLPPREKPSEWRFLIKLKNNLFQDFSIVEKSNVKKSKNPNLIWARHLDLSIVSKPRFDTDWSRRMMMSRMQTEFFGKDADKLRGRDYIELLSRNEKFDLKCGQQHCPNILRWNSPGAVVDVEFEAQNEPPELPDHVMERIRFAQFRKTLLDRDY